MRSSPSSSGSVATNAGVRAQSTISWQALHMRSICGYHIYHKCKRAITRQQASMQRTFRVGVGDASHFLHVKSQNVGPPPPSVSLQARRWQVHSQVGLGMQQTLHPRKPLPWGMTHDCPATCQPRRALRHPMSTAQQHQELCRRDTPDSLQLPLHYRCLPHMHFCPTGLP